MFVYIQWHLNLSWLFNAKSIFIQINSSISNSLIVKKILFQPFQFSQTVLIQTIQFSISIVFFFAFVFIQLNVKTVIFQTILLSVSIILISKTVLFHAIQFSVSMWLKCQNYPISSNSVWYKLILVLFDPLMGPYQVLSLWARVDLGVMAIKGYSAFPKVRAFVEPHHKML